MHSVIRNGILHVAQCTLYSVKCTLYSVQLTRYIIHGQKQYTVPNTFPGKQCTQYGVQYITRRILRTMYSVHCMQATVYYDVIQSRRTISGRIVIIIFIIKPVSCLNVYNGYVIPFTRKINTRTWCLYMGVQGCRGCRGEQRWRVGRAVGDGCYVIVLWIGVSQGCRGSVV